MNAKKMLIGMTIVGMGLSMAQTQPSNQTQPQQPGGRPGQQQMKQDRQDNPMFVTSQFLGLMPHELALLSNNTKTIAEVAKSLGKDTAKLEAALVDARNKAIDQAVTDKRITAEQATNSKAQSSTVAKAFLAQKLDPTKMGGPGGGRGGHGGPGGQGGRGPGNGQPGAGGPGGFGPQNQGNGNGLQNPNQNQNR